MKPVIGITTHLDNSRPQKIYAAVSNSYVQSILMAGGIPVMLPVVEDQDMAAEYLSVIDGLLLSGGEDVCTMVYGENPIKEVEMFCPQRDSFEINLFAAAIEQNMPVLGICRGLQVMNTALGGTLYQDIFTQCKNILGHLPRRLPVDTLYHTISIKEDSILFDIFGKNELRVNSYHHQAAKDVADAFRPTAFSTDNIIEGIEHLSRTFVIGVQWHPEDLTVKHPHFIKLFKALVDAASRD
ncbi:Predicted glutamine amidotransferase [Desulfamplus magnetovallimortis]|uniref:gamma-glutamyl-gamma-aminobutyrate hydrolase n=1 Tax=Desulfamplus magnetovallimortis TaxID=1246637 RepID=A0A1W1HIL1_9BACT|nr:gamma-glutamyl-gamma-aminobutyrate hydrolase family protein [Desulfamplus magnetovallimortis]SLM32222.1 Predicted glutamine amidotransferase [Desulfamplus magnetovallimortis]